METKLSDEETAQFEALKNELPIEEVKEEPKVETAEPAEEPKGETKEEPKQPLKEEPKQDKTVPLAALHEERSKRKQQQKELDELRDKFARADERMRVLFEKDKKDEAGHPDPTDDPIGYQSWRADQLQKQLDEKSRQVEESTGSVKSELETLKYKQYIDQQERVFERTNPDYQKALDHLVAFRGSVLEELGIDDDDERRDMVNRDLGNIVGTALQRGKNPAEAVYKMAMKMGYKKSEPEKKLDTIEKGVKASSSLGSSGGKQGSAMTAEGLAEMSDEEFAKLDYSQFRKVFGA